MRRWGVLLVLSALFVAGAILSLLQLRPEPSPRPVLALEGAEGEPRDLDTFERRVWVAAFGGEESAALLADLARESPGTPVVLLAPLAERRDPGALPAAVELRYGAPADLDALAGSLGLARPAAGAAVVSVLDRGGIPRRSLVLAPRATLADLQPVLAEIRFQRGLESRPRLHAILNGTSAVLLACGFVCIRRRWIAGHLSCMVLAGAVTCGFLVSYLYYHFHAGSVSYPGTGWTRPVYFGVLLSHTVLAAFVVPLALATYVLAARRRFSSHRGVARWTLPLWLYVSVTGVLIYWMLYVWA